MECPSTTEAHRTRWRCLLERGVWPALRLSCRPASVSLQSVHQSYAEVKINRKALLALLVIAELLPAQDRRVALVIGNGNYAAVPRLSNPANDAVDMAAKLEGLSFVVSRLVDAKLVDMEKARQKFAEDA